MYSLETWYVDVCLTLAEPFIYLGSTDYGQQQDEPVLVVTRHLAYGDVQPLETDLQGHDEVEDEDEVSLGYVILCDSYGCTDSRSQEALFREVSPGRQLSVEYHILLSSSYQVPVLYFSILDPAQSLPQTLDTVYQYLVPDRFQANLQGMAVMGGITKGVSGMH